MAVCYMRKMLIKSTTGVVDAIKNFSHSLMLGSSKMYFEQVSFLG